MVILTNYRFAVNPKPKTSRGKLVYHFLSTKFVDEDKFGSSENIEGKIRDSLKILLEEQKGNYSPFNLIVYHIPSAKLFYTCN